VFNKSLICFGPTTKNLGKLGSTSAKSNIFLASKSLATVNPPQHIPVMQCKAFDQMEVLQK
jgi:hypothetical protein